MWLGQCIRLVKHVILPDVLCFDYDISFVFEFLKRFSVGFHHFLGFLFHHTFKQQSCNHVRLSQEVKQKDLHPKAKLAPHLASRAKAVPYQLLAF